MLISYNYHPSSAHFLRWSLKHKKKEKNLSMHYQWENMMNEQILQCTITSDFFQ